MIETAKSNIVPMGVQQWTPIFYVRIESETIDIRTKGKGAYFSREGYYGNTKQRKL